MKHIVASVIFVLFSTPLSSLAKTDADQSCSVSEVEQDVNTPVPPNLEGATILVKTKDGKVREMSANEFKVVPRKQQFKVRERTVYAPCQEAEEKTSHKNILSLTLGRSLTDYSMTAPTTGTVRVENQYKLAPGLMYQREIFDRVYLGAHVDTHKTVGGSVGIGF